MNITTLPNNIQKELPEVIEKYAINTRLRLSHFLAQCAHESNNFSTTIENLNYSTSGLMNTFKKYFNTQQALAYAHHPERIANRVYANRMGNRGEESGDGWKHRGAGYLQITGKDNQITFLKAVGENEDKVSSIATKYPLLSAAWYWDAKGLNRIADTDNIEAVTKLINGGLNGLDSRKKYLAYYKKIL